MLCKLLSMLNSTLQLNGSCLLSLEKEMTPVLLPGEFQGERSLMGCSLWGHTELATTDVT